MKFTYDELILLKQLLDTANNMLEIVDSKGMDNIKRETKGELWVLKGKIRNEIVRRINDKKY